MTCSFITAFKLSAWASSQGCTIITLPCRHFEHLLRIPDTITVPAYFYEAIFVISKTILYPVCCNCKYISVLAYCYAFLLHAVNAKNKSVYSKEINIRFTLSK